MKTRSNTGALVKSGYTFVGWNTTAGGSGISYATGVTFAMGPANMTLYAQWTANPTYTVTYNGNGNSSGTVPLDANNYESGSTVTVQNDTGALPRQGMRFSAGIPLRTAAGPPMSAARRLLWVRPA